MAEYFIHPDGNDLDAGDLGEPFATVQKGIDSAISPGDIVSVIHDPSATDSIHYISDVLTCGNSGTPLSPIVVRGVNASGTPGTRAKIDVTTSLINHFTGTGKFINVTDFDLGNYTGNLFASMSHLKVSGVRQVTGSASGVGVWGSNFAASIRYSVFSDCQQIVSRTSFVSNANTLGSCLFNRCYSNFGFTSSSERNADSFFYCIANGAAVGFSIASLNYSTVGKTLIGCIAINCDVGALFRYGSIFAHKLTILNSVGNGIDLMETGAAGGMVYLSDSLIVDSGGYGIEFKSSDRQMLCDERNRFYNNTSGSLSHGSLDPTSTEGVDPGINATTLQIGIDSPAANVEVSVLDYITRISAGAMNPAYPTPAQIATAVWARTGRTLT